MKTSQLPSVREVALQGDLKRALALAAKFPQPEPYKAAITRGSAAMQNPDFYRQLGKDPDALVAAGIEALKSRYGL